MKKIEPLSLAGIQTYSLSERPSKVSRADFGRAWEKGGSLTRVRRPAPPYPGGRDPAAGGRGLG